MSERIVVPVAAVTADNFAPFGHVLAQPAAPPEFVGPGYATWRYPLALGGRPDLTLLRHPWRPLVCARLERHTQVTEVRIPMDDGASVVFVANTPGAPAPADVRGFLVPGDTAIMIARNCWHSSSFAVDPRGALFALVSDRETEDELERAAVLGPPHRFTHVLDWSGRFELVPDLAGLGRPDDRVP